MHERHVDEQIDGYALGALEPEEVAEVEAHLAVCERCRELEAASRRVVDLLHSAVGEFEPPPERVWEGIVARITSKQRGYEASLRPESARPAPLSLMERVRRVLGGHGVVMPREHPTDALQVALELLTSPHVALHQLSSTDEAPGAQARLLVAPEHDRAVLYAAGLAPLPSDRIYQLWLLCAGRPEDAGVFTVDRAGRGWLVVRAHRQLGHFEAAAITQEPAGGSPGPTTPILVMGTLR
jgi:anti-sigma-K factor RskA